MFADDTPHKTGPRPHLPESVKCYLSWKKGLCRCHSVQLELRPPRMLYAGPVTSVLHKTWEKVREGSVTVGVKGPVRPRAKECVERLKMGEGMGKILS